MYMVSISLSGTLLVSFAPRPFFLISYLVGARLKG